MLNGTVSVCLSVCACVRYQFYYRLNGTMLVALKIASFYKHSDVKLNSIIRFNGTSLILWNELSS